jgi:hypothetical protein
MPTMRPIFVLAGMILAGCSIGADPTMPPRLQAADPPDIPRLAAKIQDIFKAAKLSGNPRISPAHQAPVTALADWVVCLRGDAESDPRVYALLISGNDVADYRLALMVDQCANQEFEPLPAAPPIK